MKMTEKYIDPIHPGEILLEEFMEPLGITQYRLAKDIHVQPTRIGEILRKKRSVSPDTAIRLGIYFKTSTEFWLNLQMRYDLNIAEMKFAQKKHEIKPYAA